MNVKATTYATQMVLVRILMEAITENVKTVMKTTPLSVSTLMNVLTASLVQTLMHTVPILKVATNVAVFSVMTLFLIPPVGLLVALT